MKKIIALIALATAATAAFADAGPKNEQVAQARAAQASQTAVASTNAQTSRGGVQAGTSMSGAGTFVAPDAKLYAHH